MAWKPYARILAVPHGLLAGCSLFWLQHGRFFVHGFVISLATYAVGVAALLAVPITRRRLLARR